MGRRVLLNLLTVGVSTAARLLGTLALFALMARAVSVEQFGVFSYWYTFSVIAGTFTDYGFAQQILKEALSEDSAKVAMRIRLLWRAKLIIALVCALVSIVCIFSTSRSSPEVMSAMLIVAAGLLGSYFEFYAMVLRGRQLYRDESRMSLANALGWKFAGWLCRVSHQERCNGEHRFVHCANGFCLCRSSTCRSTCIARDAKPTALE